MGCGSSSPVAPQHQFSLTGKSVKEVNYLKSKTVVSEQGVVPIYYTRDSTLINQLNKEIAFRLKEASAIPKNQESEFIDLRNTEEFNKSHIHLFMNMDSNKEQALSSSDQTLKILFDFKNIFFLADSNDQRSLEPANSMIQFRKSQQLTLNESGIAAANVQQTQQNIRIPSRIKSVIKLFNSKSVKAKSYNIIQSDYTKLESEFPNYVVENFQSKKVENIIQSENQPNLVGENEIFAGTLFTQIQLPLFLYDHNDFIASNQKGVKISTNKPNQIYVQSLPHFLSSIKTREGKQYYTNSIKIQTICLTNQVITAQEIAEINQIFHNTSPKHFLLKEHKENKIQLMKQLYSNIESGQNTLIIRDNSKDNFLDVITVFKALMYEKYCVFSTNIQEYLLNSVPKSVAYQINNTVSMAVNIGDRTQTNRNFGDESKIEKDKSEMNRCQQLTELIIPIFKQNKKNKNKSDNFNEVFTKLFENLIRNPNEEKYRIIKKENKIIKEAILNYKQSSSILSLCGFIDKGDIFQNQLSSSDNNFIKGDFDLAIKNALKEVYNQ